MSLNRGATHFQLGPLLSHPQNYPGSPLLHGSQDKDFVAAHLSVVCLGREGQVERVVPPPFSLLFKSGNKGAGIANTSQNYKIR